MPGSYAQQHNDIYCNIGYLSDASIKRQLWQQSKHIRSVSAKRCRMDSKRSERKQEPRGHNSSSFLLGLRGSFVRPIHFYEAAPTKRLIDERPRILTA
jgi:hypothetical protein